MGAKEDYQQKIEGQLKEWQAEIDRFNAKVQQMQADAKIQGQKELDSLRLKAQETRNSLDRLKQAGEGAWEEGKVGVDRAWQELKSSFEKAASRFK